MDAIASISEKYYNLDNDSVLNSFNKPLKYPLDLLDTGQDILVIQQFRYQPPRQDIFKDPKNILQNGIQRKSALRDKPLVQIFLPIPNNLQDSNNVSWGPDNMNNLTAAAAGAVLSKPGDYIASATTGALIGAISSALGLGGSVGSGAELGAKFKMLADLYTSAQGSNEATALAGTALSSQILNMAGFEVSPESILANAAGLVPNSNLELLFNAPALREFRFDYRFSPRSEKEATTLRHIIRSFKQGMAPRKRNSSAGSASYFLATPNVFQLRYKTSNKEGIPGLNKFKICALTGFAVNYTPDGQWASYDGGQPVSYMVSMSFNELEPIYANDYSERIASGLENDLEPVGDDDIGY